MQRKTFLRGLMAFAIAAGGVIVSAITPFDEPLIVLLVPVIVAAYLGGLGLGLLATATVSFGALALTPLQITNGLELAELISLAIAGAFVSAICEVLRRARVRAELNGERAERSERRYSETFHASPLPQMISNAETGQIVDVNATYVALCGWSRDELIGQSSLHLGIYAEAARMKMARILQRCGVLRDHDAVLTRKTGEQREVRVSAVIVELDGAPHCVTTIVDVTDSERIKAELASSNERFVELAGAITEVFWMTDPSKVTMYYVSPAYEQVWGRSCESLYASPKQWAEAIHPDERDRVLASAMAGPVTQGEVLEYRIVRPDGALRWIRNRSYAVRDATGAVVRIAGVASDVTDQRMLEDQLRQAQKMESLGQLAGGVAHDFNNLIAVVSTNASILAETLKPGTDEREMIAEIEHVVTRAVGLTRQLLAFSRKQAVEPVVLDLNATVAETRKMLRRMIGEDVALETSLEPELDRVRMDPGHLVQVLMNLAVNARDAMPRGGKLVIATRNVEPRSVMLEIRDTGCGMSPEVQAHVFEPFFTTKGVGKGTGMGLAVVHGIVEQAGGKISLTSAPDAGTTFQIVLPSCADGVAAEVTTAPMLTRGIETVLVVDDDAHVRHAASRALRSNGYTVLEAGDGMTALRVLGQAAVDLVVTDVVMPGMDGRELIEAARNALPELKVLYTSGYTEDEVIRHGVVRGEVELLEKPYRVRALAGKIRAMLDQ